MTRIIAALAFLALLAGCGVDGSPTPPPAEPAIGLTLSGTAEIGVTGGS